MSNFIQPLMLFALLTLFIVSSSSETIAQSPLERTQVKSWLTANKTNVKLVSLGEYESMSPQVKKLIDQDSKTLVFDKVVTLSDIQILESKNPQGTFINVPLNSDFAEELARREAKKANEHDPVNLWVKSKSGQVKVYSQSQYDSFDQSVKDKIDALPASKRLIYQGEKLTEGEIQAFELAQKTK